MYCSKSGIKTKTMQVKHMKVKHVNKLLRLATAMLVLSGCTIPMPKSAIVGLDPFQAYPGVPRPIAELAAIKAVPDTYISLVDGTPGPVRYSDLGFNAFIKRTAMTKMDGQTVHLMPGSHEIVLNRRNALRSHAYRVTLEAGKRYIVTSRFRKESIGKNFRDGMLQGLGARTFHEFDYVLQEEGCGLDLPMTPVNAKP